MTIDERLEQAFEHVRPATPEEMAPELPASVQAILQHQDFREAIEKHSAAKAAAEQERQEQREAMELLEILSEATGLPHGDLMKELAYTPEQRAARAKDIENSEKPEPTASERSIRWQEAKAVEMERKGLPEAAEEHRTAAEMIRRKDAAAAAGDDALAAAVKSRYHPKPAEEETADA